MTAYLPITFPCCHVTRLVSSPSAEVNARAVHECRGAS